MNFPLNIPISVLVQGGKSDWSDVPLLKNRVFQIGLIWPLFSGMSSILHSFFPAVPVFSGIDLQLWRLFTEEPLVSALGWHYPLHFVVSNPAWVGISYFIPLDAAFSLVFFEGMLYVQRIFVAIGGWNNYIVPAREVQGTAGLFSLAVWLLWLMRNDIKHMFLVAIGRVPEHHIDDRNEPLSHRTTVLGIIFGSIFAVGFFRVFLGTPILSSCLYIGILFLALLGYSRIRAEAGFPSVIAAQGYGMWVWNSTFGPLINPTYDFGLGILFNLEYSGFGTYTALLGETLDLGDKVKLNRRNLTLFVVIIFIVATLLGFAFVLPVIYTNGMYQLRQFTAHQAINEGWRASIAWGTEPKIQGPRPQIFLAATVLTLILSVMRARFVWWPFHPIGYIASGNDIMGTLWGSVFVVWILKLILYRYAGSSVVKKLAPGFVALILGSAGMSVIGCLVSNLRLILT